MALARANRGGVLTMRRTRDQHVRLLVNKSAQTLANSARSRSMQHLGVGLVACGLGLAGLGEFGVDNRRSKSEYKWVDANGQRGGSEGKATNSRPCPTANNFASCDVFALSHILRGSCPANCSTLRTPSISKSLSIAGPTEIRSPRCLVSVD